MYSLSVHRACSRYQGQHCGHQCSDSMFGCLGSSSGRPSENRRFSMSNRMSAAMAAVGPDCRGRSKSDPVRAAPKFRPALLPLPRSPWRVPDRKRLPVRGHEVMCRAALLVPADKSRQRMPYEPAQQTCPFDEPEGLQGFGRENTCGFGDGTDLHSARNAYAEHWWRGQTVGRDAAHGTSAVANASAGMSVLRSKAPSAVSRSNSASPSASRAMRWARAFARASFTAVIRTAVWLAAV